MVDKVDALKYPRIKEAIQLIFVEDQVLTMPDELNLSASWDESFGDVDIDKAEAFLAGLPDDEFTELCIGDRDEILPKLRGRYPEEEVENADTLMDVIFARAGLI